MIKQIRKFFWTKVAEWKYRKQEYNEVCCCGQGMITYHRWGRDCEDNTHEEWKDCPDYYCPSRCAKEYAVTSYVEEKIKNV